MVPPPRARTAMIAALSRIELRHLRYFLAVADTLHFGRAAERLCMSQPPLSQAIQQLEDALGVAVFERHSRKVALTPAGQALLVPARQVLAGLQAAIDAAHAAARGERGVLRVAYVGSAVFSALPAIIARFHADFPDVALQLQEAPPDTQLIGLRSGQLDASLVRPGRAQPGLCCDVLLDEPTWLALPSRHPLTRHDALPLVELSGEPFITIDAADGGHVLELYRSQVFQPRIVQHVRDLHTAFALVAAGLGLLLIPRSATRQPRPGVSYRPVPGAPQLDLCLLTPDPAGSPIIGHFRRVAREVMEASPDRSER